MLGFLSAILAGAAMSVQGVMNTRLGEKVGTLETNAFVQLVGFLLALLIAIFFGKGNIRLLPQAPWYAWLGGVLAPVITLTVMWAIGSLTPTVAISAILLSQLTVAALIDVFGWLGAEKMPFSWEVGRRGADGGRCHPDENQDVIRRTRGNQQDSGRFSTNASDRCDKHSHFSSQETGNQMAKPPAQKNRRYFLCCNPSAMAIG